MIDAKVRNTIETFHLLFFQQQKIDSGVLSLSLTIQFHDYTTTNFAHSTFVYTFGIASNNFFLLIQIDQSQLRWISIQHYTLRFDFILSYHYLKYK